MMRTIATLPVIAFAFLLAACPQASSGELTEQDVRDWVTRAEQTPQEDYRGIDEAASTVTFQSVEIADGRAPTEQDRINGVRADTFYPVRVRYTVQRRLRSGETGSADRHWSYDFYRDPFGQWATVSHGPAR